MAATIEGGVAYAAVVGSSLSDRSCFDGTVPRCFSCAGDVIFNNASGATATGEAKFSLTGTPRNALYAINTDDTRRVLTSQSAVSLRDIWFVVEGEAVPGSNANYNCQCMVTLCVCDPTLDFPDAANTNYLYQCVVFCNSPDNNRIVRVPDIDGLVIATGLNVVCRVSFYAPNNTNTTVSFHAVSVIDD